VAPLYTTPFPVSFSNTRCGVKNIYLFGNTIHPVFLTQLSRIFSSVGADSDVDISPFIELLEDFIVDFYHPVSPVPLTPKPTLHPLTIPIHPL
jgi:hypothetical protein